MEQLKTMTDEQLAIKYMEGNNQAFDILLSRNQNKLFAYILFVVHDEGLANDVFQETFVKIIVKLQNGLYEPS
ncbi:RNA polymerase subunit sigma-24, partial [Pseudomonas donghuensis]|nr:RNA polymerase subunit sigma-24 [Pseudomonas donghuensis]